MLLKIYFVKTPTLRLTCAYYIYIFHLTSAKRGTQNMPDGFTFPNNIIGVDFDS